MSIIDTQGLLSLAKLLTFALESLVPESHPDSPQGTAQRSQGPSNHPRCRLQVVVSETGACSFALESLVPESPPDSPQEIVQ
jgi:hypothetical protein